MPSPMRGFPSPQACPSCGDPMTTSRFDLTVCDDAGVERLFFGMPGSACPDCSLFALDSDAPGLFGIGPGDVVSAIESDAFLRASSGLDAA